MKHRKSAKSHARFYLLFAQVIVLVAAIATALYLQSTQPHKPNLPSPPLKSLAAAHGLALGNFAIRNHLSDPIYTDILTSQFNFVLADNTPNWYFTDGGLQPGPNTYNWRQMDQIVAFAEKYNMPIQAHHYVWGEQKWLPDWLKNGHYTSQQLLEIMREHILTVGRHYSGKIAEWSVVNEAFTRAEHIYGLHDWWADHIGGDSYIDQAFIWARQADPHSKLILNDFNNAVENSTSNAMYDYIKSALQRGVPIDGIGMQMHIDGTNPPKKADVIANMKRFAALGVGIYVTEFDLNMNDVKGSAAAKDAKEGEIYYNMMRACIESGVCHSFAYLGITDAETWYNYLGLKAARPLMFDNKYSPKPAFFKTRLALSQK